MATFDACQLRFCSCSKKCLSFLSRNWRTLNPLQATTSKLETNPQSQQCADALCNWDQTSGAWRYWYILKQSRYYHAILLDNKCKIKKDNVHQKVNNVYCVTHHPTIEVRSCRLDVVISFTHKTTLIVLVFSVHILRICTDYLEKGLQCTKRLPVEISQSPQELNGLVPDHLGN
jgi:hypothetical protein